MIIAYPKQKRKSQFLINNEISVNTVYRSMEVMNMIKKHVLMMALMLTLYLGIHNGQIAVFRNGKVTKVFPYSASILPPDARNALEEGIAYSTNEELAKLLQTYLS